jgi:hypothetical protein
MVTRKPHRVVRELTVREREILQSARAIAEVDRESLLEQAREAKKGLAGDVARRGCADGKMDS